MGDQAAVEFAFVAAAIVGCGPFLILLGMAVCELVELVFLSPPGDDEP